MKITRKTDQKIQTLYKDSKKTQKDPNFTQKNIQTNTFLNIELTMKC